MIVEILQELIPILILVWIAWWIMDRWGVDAEDY